MKCPFCKEMESKVMDSRIVEDAMAVRRRRECQACHKRFTTYERYSGMPLMVKKKDKKSELFDRRKVRIGILKACNKRGISKATIDKIVESVEEEIRKISNTEVPAKVVGTIIMKKLKQMDNVSYVRFASVFKEFNDTSSFIKEVKEIDTSRSG
ncbi:MAG: transcriptional regulator NrdR [Candidatus Eremiobacteraeota bacterium]|nr:transcriptional regulator NrdR [Candidatus Eremiobacteraeota bacterium]